MGNKRIIVADIGGTNARFAIATVSGPSVVLNDIQHYQLKDYATLIDALQSYLSNIQVIPKHACFAVAAPVHDGLIHLTNSPWTFDRDEIYTRLTLDRLTLVNDFEALAAGIAHVHGDETNGETVLVKRGKPVETAPMLVIGPGTGLGQALLVPMGEGMHVIATQGGYTNFAPQTDEQKTISDYIERNQTPVCVEHVLSGQGLENIYAGLQRRDQRQTFLKAEAITRAAIDQSDPVAIRAVDIFCAVLGDVVGDAVLSTGARGGVYLGGGILPRIQSLLLASAFTRQFSNKGKMRDFMTDIPVKLILGDHIALRGAARMERGGGCDKFV